MRLRRTELKWAPFLLLLLSGCGKPQAPPPLEYALAPKQLTDRCEAASSVLTTRLDKIAALRPDARRFENVVVAREEALADFLGATDRLSVLAGMHPDAAVRQAASGCGVMEDAAYARALGRLDVGIAVLDVGRRHPPASGTEEARLLELTASALRRGGLDLESAARARLGEINGRIAQLSAEYSDALAADHRRLTLDVAELDGASRELVARLPRDAAGRLLLGTNFPDVFGILTDARREDVRHRVWVFFMQRGGKANADRLDEIVRLRRDMARVLGEPSYTALAAGPRMMRTAGNVHAFVDHLRAGLAGPLARDMKALRALRAQEHPDQPADLPLGTWDYFYYQSVWRKKALALDDEAVRAHLPADRVIAGLFAVFGRVLGIRIREVAGATAWVPGVRLYEVLDAASGVLQGRFYLDLYPRPGKWANGQNIVITWPQDLPSGRLPGLSLLMTTIEPPSAQGPAHFSHDEVKTLFHEFGHTMQATLVGGRYRSVHKLVDDFNEMPSQFWERWVYEPEVLRLITDEAGLPSDLLGKIARSRTLSSALYWSGQLAYSVGDLALHDGDQPVDSNETLRRAFAEVGGQRTDPNEYWGASFIHLSGDSKAAGYYGYQWSAVLARDMYMPFLVAGPLDAATGLAFRRKVLEPGNRREAADLVADFLGRPASDSAFLKELEAGP